MTKDELSAEAAKHGKSLCDNPDCVGFGPHWHPDLSPALRELLTKENRERNPE